MLKSGLLPRSLISVRCARVELLFVDLFSCSCFSVVCGWYSIGLRGGFMLEEIGNYKREKRQGECCGLIIREERHNEDRGLAIEEPKSH